MPTLAHKFEHRARLPRLRDPVPRQSPGELFEKAAARAEHPVRVSGGQSFFDRAEIRTSCAYLRLIVNDDDDPAFMRAITTPRRGVGATTLERLGDAFAAKLSLRRRVRDQPRSRRAAGAAAGRLTSSAIDEWSRYRAEARGCGRLLDELIKSIGYEQYLVLEVRPARRQPLGSIIDFVDWIAAQGREPTDKKRARAGPDGSPLR